MNWEFKYYLPLIVYFVVLPFLSGDSVFITLLIELVSIAFIFLYRFIQEDVLFYLYIFFSLLAAVPAFYNRNIFAVANLITFYALLSLPLIHIEMHKFERKYGKIAPESTAYYLSSTILSFLLLSLMLFMPFVIDVYLLVFMVFAVALFLYYLSRS